MFDGSFVINPDVSLASRLPFWHESLTLTHWMRTVAGFRCEGVAHWTEEPRLSSIYHAMMLELRDYVERTASRV